MTEQQNTPPWGNDEDFNPEKAWALIQELRAQKNDPEAHQEFQRLKDENAVLKDERDNALGQVGQKEKTIEELQATVQLTDDTVKTRESELSEFNTLRTKENLLIDAGLPRKFASQVVGDDEDAWNDSVQNLVELRGGASQERRPDPAQAAEPQIDERAALAEQLFGSN